MLNCLTDYIGVEGCSSTTPDSGIYINQLPGVSLKLISKLANDDQATFEDVWSDVQNRAIRRFARDVRAQFRKKYKLRSIRQSIETPKEIDTGSTTTASNQYRGMVIELDDQSGEYVCSNLQNIYVQYVKFYATNGANDVVVKIFDLDTGDTLKTVTLASADVTANAWNTVKILDSFEEERIFIAVDCSNFDTVELNVTDTRTAALIDGCHTDLDGAVSATGTPTTITRGDNIHGVAPVFSIECSFDGIICRNLKTFETSFLYCLGMELMDERIFSEKLNEFTTFGQDKARENRQLFHIQYLGGEIDEIQQVGELQAVIDGIEFNDNDKCIDCGASVNFSHEVSV